VTKRRCSVDNACSEATAAQAAPDARASRCPIGLDGLGRRAAARFGAGGDDGPGKLGNIGFSTPGTFSYSSAPDCLNGNSTPGFNCGPYTVVVSDVVLPGPAGPTATPVPTAISALAAPAANTAISIDDARGFTPSTLVAP
jgi:hypothetical protein